MTDDRLPWDVTGSGEPTGPGTDRPLKTTEGKRPLAKGWRILLIFLGLLSVLLGVIGIVVPGLPTTAFLLLAAYLFARSSERMRIWLLNSPVLGRFIRDYQKRGGVSPQTRIRAIILIWTMIGLSTWLFIHDRTVDVIVIILGGIGTLVMGFLVPSARK
jgi:uncharacterized membrane protein YbaN (DUF454 family)